MLSVGSKASSPERYMWSEVDMVAGTVMFSDDADSESEMENSPCGMLDGDWIW
jgi:hypothetical protein